MHYYSKIGAVIVNSKLKERRQKLGLTQDAVSKAAQVSLRVYQYYETGKRIPRADTAKVIAAFLHSTVEELF